MSFFDRDDMWFDYDSIDKYIRFVYQMRHYQGIFKNKHFVLLPWEQWVFAGLWGFRWKSDDTVVTNRALIFCARKNAKTALCAAIALIHVWFQENGAEVDFMANSVKQAHIAMDHTQNFAKSIDPKGKYFKKYRDSIKVPKTQSVIQVLSTDTASLDGYNSSLFIFDEFHSQKDWDLYNVLISSMGMRRNPLAIVISTAGFLLDGFPLFDYRQNCIDILNGMKDDDSQFSAIYELDEDDDFADSKCWIKCTPSLGETVTYKYLENQVLMARNQPSQMFGVLTKNFNRFCHSQNQWIPDFYILDVMEPVDIRDFKNEACYDGVDLGSVSDMTCNAVLFPPNSSRSVYPDKYVFKVFSYIPEACLDGQMNRDLYRSWKSNGYIDVTPGNSTDYDYILRDQKKIAAYTDLIGLYYDEWNARSWAINATNEGLPLTVFSQSLGNFNRPTKELEKLILDKRVIIDRNPVIRFAFMNCELKSDWNENVKPVKAGGERSKKIDPVISMITALGGYLAEGMIDE